MTLFLRALVAFLILPGVAAFVLPLYLVTLDPWRGEPLFAGLPVMLLGLALLLWCVRDFYVAGKGTLAPWDPPAELVVTGLYRHVRNPMYLAVVTLVAGWALLLASPLVAIYGAVLALAFHLRVVLAEEPWMERQFGAACHQYLTHVPRWRPRLRPWRGVR